MKSTDLAHEYNYKEHIEIPFSNWMDEDECIKQSTLEEFYNYIPNKSSRLIPTFLFLLI